MARVQGHESPEGAGVTLACSVLRLRRMASGQPGVPHQVLNQFTPTKAPGAPTMEG